MRCCMHILFLFSRPTGPGHRPSLSIFFDFHVFRISRPRFPLEIPGSYSGYSHWGSARDGPSSARACPPSRPSPPSFMFRGGPRHPFSRVRTIYETRFFSHNFFWRPSGFVESDTTASRNFEFRDAVVSDSTKPDGNGPALWSCWVPLNVFQCRITGSKLIKKNSVPGIVRTLSP